VKFRKYQNLGRYLSFNYRNYPGVLYVLFKQDIGAYNPNPEKLTSYECGEEPTGNAWLPFNSRFYVIALVFLLFDVEMVFIFRGRQYLATMKLLPPMPWGWFSLAEMFIFLGIPDIRTGLCLAQRRTWTG